MKMELMSCVSDIISASIIRGWYDVWCSCTLFSFSQNLHLVVTSTKLWGNCRRSQVVIGIGHQWWPHFSHCSLCSLCCDSRELTVGVSTMCSCITFHISVWCWRQRRPLKHQILTPSLQSWSWESVIPLHIQIVRLSPTSHQKIFQTRAFDRVHCVSVLGNKQQGCFTLFECCIKLNWNVIKKIHKCWYKSDRQTKRLLNHSWRDRSCGMLCLDVVSVSLSRLKGWICPCIESYPLESHSRWLCGCTLLPECMLLFCFGL